MPVRLMMHVRVEKESPDHGDTAAEDFSRVVVGESRRALASKFAAFVRDVASMFGDRDEVLTLLRRDPARRRIGFHDTTTPPAEGSG